MHRVVPRSTAGSAVSTAPSIAPSTAPSTAPSITLSVAPIPTPCPTPWLCSCSSAPSPASAAEQIASPKRLSEVRGGGAVLEGMCPGMGCTSCFPMVALRKGRGVSPHCPGERGLCTGKKGDEAHFGMLPCYAPPPPPCSHPCFPPAQRIAVTPNFRTVLPSPVLECFAWQLAAISCWANRALSLMHRAEITSVCCLGMLLLLLPLPTLRTHGIRDQDTQCHHQTQSERRSSQ